MSEPTYYLQIVDRQGRVLRLPAGGTLERDLIESFVEKVAAKYIGVLRTHKQSVKVVREALAEAVLELKMETIKVGP